MSVFGFFIPFRKDNAHGVLGQAPPQEPALLL